MTRTQLDKANILIANRDNLESLKKRLETLKIEKHVSLKLSGLRDGDEACNYFELILGGCGVPDCINNDISDSIEDFKANVEAILINHITKLNREFKDL